MSGPSSPPAPGDTIAGKYRLIRVLGEGAMGIVFEATHERLGKRVALKFLNPEAAAVEDHRARFIREAQVAVRLQSIHTVRVLDVDSLPGGPPYIVMEYLAGVDLRTVIGAHEGGQLPIEQAVDYVQQVALAMAEAHERGIVHRDIKPENLFVCDLPGTDRKLIKVVDFGISKSGRKADMQTATDAAFGTPQYMSPEHILSTKDVDARSDLWSLGIVLYELLAGRAPFVGPATAIICAIPWDAAPPLSEFRKGLPSDLERVAMRLLEKEPPERHQSAIELFDALKSFGPDEPISAVLARVAHTDDGELGPAPSRAPTNSVPTLLADASSGPSTRPTSPPIAALDRPEPTRRPDASRSRRGALAGAALGLVCIGGLAFVLFPAASPKAPSSLVSARGSASDHVVLDASDFAANSQGDASSELRDVSALTLVPAASVSTDAVRAVTGPPPTRRPTLNEAPKVRPAPAVSASTTPPNPAYL